jgi:hypothetical protein
LQLAKEDNGWGIIMPFNNLKGSDAFINSNLVKRKPKTTKRGKAQR